MNKKVVFKKTESFQFLFEFHWKWLHILVLHYWSRTQWGLFCHVHDDVIKWKYFLHYWPFVHEFPAQSPMTQSSDVSFDLRPNKQLSKQWWGWWFETPSCPLWRHCNALYCSCHILAIIQPVGLFAHFSTQIVMFMGPTWVLSAPDGPHVGPMNLAIRVVLLLVVLICNVFIRQYCICITYAVCDQPLPELMMT